MDTHAYVTVSVVTPDVGIQGVHADSTGRQVLLALALTAYGEGGPYLWELDDDAQLWRALACMGWKIYANRDTGARVFARPCRRGDGILGRCGLYCAPRCFATLGDARAFLHDNHIDGFGSTGALNEHIFGAARARSVRRRAMEILVLHLCAQRPVPEVIDAELLAYVGFDLAAPAPSGLRHRTSPTLPQ